MKKFLFLLLSLVLVLPLKSNAQVYSLGQVVENPDGSRGVVFYLNEDGTEGWMVALHDVSMSVPWGLEDHVEGLGYVEITNNDFLTSLLADTDGYSYTLAIREHYQNIGYTGPYAARDVDFNNGWYLPAAGQLKMLYVNAIFYETSLESVGEKMGLHPYWSSSVSSDEKAWYVHFGSPYPEEAWAWNAYFGRCSRTENVAVYGGYFAVRPIRNLDFSPLPHIGQLQAPALICGEGPLDLVLPGLVNVENYGWEIASDPSFDAPVAYVGQTLDGTYNGWYLRLWSTNNEGTTYSNVVEISVHSPSAYQFSVQICEPPFVWNGTAYNESGTIQQVFDNQWGCDSVVNISLTVGHNVEYQFMDMACGEYEWNGQVYTESGRYQQSFLTPEGCDSIVTLSLTIKPAPIVSEIQGETNIYYGSYGEFVYRIDSVADAMGYAWSIDNRWQLTSSLDSPECSVNINSIGKATLSVRVFTECGFEDRQLLICHDREPGCTIFPNPTEGDLTLFLFGMEGKTIVRVHDILGNLISQDEIATDVKGVSVPFNLNGKATGIYLFTIINNRDIITKKVVKGTAISQGEN